MKERIGPLKQLIKFHMALISQGTTGERIQNWIESNEIWAKADFQLSSSETIEGPGIAATGNVIFTIRYLKAIDEKMRVVHEDSVFEILSVLPDNNKTYTRIEARKIDTAKPLYWVDGSGNIWEDDSGNGWILKDAYTQPSLTGLDWQDANSNQWVMT